MTGDLRPERSRTAEHALALSAATGTVGLVASWALAADQTVVARLAIGALCVIAPVTLTGWMNRLGLPWSRVLASSLVWFWAVELTLIATFVGLSYVWEWWRDGQRVTGVIVELREDDPGSSRTATIRDPATELELRFELGTKLAPWDARFWGDGEEIGDTATAVIMPGDPTKVDSPGAVQFYVICWIALALLAVALPARRWRPGTRPAVRAVSLRRGPTGSGWRRSRRRR